MSSLRSGRCYCSLNGHDARAFAHRLSQAVRSCLPNVAQTFSGTREKSRVLRCAWLDIAALAF